MITSNEQYKIFTEAFQINVLADDNMLFTKDFIKETFQALIYALGKLEHLEEISLDYKDKIKRADNNYESLCEKYDEIAGELSKSVLDARRCALLYEQTQAEFTQARAEIERLSNPLVNNAIYVNHLVEQGKELTRIKNIGVEEVARVQHEAGQQVYYSRFGERAAEFDELSPNARDAALGIAQAVLDFINGKKGE